MKDEHIKAMLDDKPLDRMINGLRRLTVRD